MVDCPRSLRGVIVIDHTRDGTLVTTNNLHGNDFLAHTLLVDQQATVTQFKFKGEL